MALNTRLATLKRNSTLGYEVDKLNQMSSKAMRNWIVFPPARKRLVPHRSHRWPLGGDIETRDRVLEPQPRLEIARRQKGTWRKQIAVGNAQILWWWTVRRRWGAVDDISALDKVEVAAGLLTICRCRAAASG